MAGQSARDVNGNFHPLICYVAPSSVFTRLKTEPRRCGRLSGWLLLFARATGSFEETPLRLPGRAPEGSRLPLAESLPCRDLTLWAATVTDYLPHSAMFLRRWPAPSICRVTAHKQGPQTPRNVSQTSTLDALGSLYGLHGLCHCTAWRFELNQMASHPASLPGSKLSARSSRKRSSGYSACPDGLRAWRLETQHFMNAARMLGTKQSNTMGISASVSPARLPPTLLCFPPSPEQISLEAACFLKNTLRLG